MRGVDHLCGVISSAGNSRTSVNHLQTDSILRWLGKEMISLSPAG